MVLEKSVSAIRSSEYFKPADFRRALKVTACFKRRERFQVNEIRGFIALQEFSRMVSIEELFWTLRSHAVKIRPFFTHYSTPH